MKKRHAKYRFRQPMPPASVHFENLIELRECNQQAYARLGEGPHRAVEKYEVERLASAFEHRDGTERLLDLRERLPRVYARFTDQTKRMVELYAERRRAYDLSRTVAD